MGGECVVYTDNDTLTYVQKSAKQGATEMKWVGELAHAVQLEHQTPIRKTEQYADSLSRKTQHPPEVSRLEQVCVEPNSWECPTSSLGTEVKSSLEAI